MVAIIDLGDEIRRHPITTVDECGVRADQLQRRQRVATERHRQRRLPVFGWQAKTGGVFEHILRP